MKSLASKLVLCLVALCLATATTPTRHVSQPLPPSPRPVSVPRTIPLQELFEKKQDDQRLWRESVWLLTIQANDAKKAQQRAAVQEQSQHVAHFDGDVWSSLAQCESGMTNAATGNGFYGYFQFVPSTWRSLGYSGLPTDYSYETQREAAMALQARSGWGQWPACSKKLGLA